MLRAAASSEAERAAEPETGAVRPDWYDAFACALQTRAQIRLDGNVRDLFPIPAADGLRFVQLADCLWHLGAGAGLGALFVRDPVAGVRLHAGVAAGRGAEPACLAAETPGAGAASWELATLIDRMVAEAALPAALVVDYAGQALRDAADTGATLVRIDRRMRAPGPPRPAGIGPCPPRNPLVWVLEQPGDLPDWFAVGNETLARITIGLPDLETRHAFAGTLVPEFADADEIAAETRAQALESFAFEAEGMTLAAMASVAALARVEGIGLARVSDAIRAWRIGTRRNPWRAPLMRGRVARGHEILARRVKGQDHAIARTLAILERSVMGLSGVQSSASHARPRGVLFLAGPSGVGKTELAKAVTELLFGDESACTRFDMTEFMAEASLSRLLGAPPGQPGHDLGGELTNAVRQRPFSVLLFDEVEKAHPRILDTFLQVIDEGRLTDSRGETAHFSESLVIFTSNVGVMGRDRATNMGLNVLPSDEHDALETKILKAVREFFRFDMRRPELMNRIGQNVVVFDFINPRSARLIFAGIVERVRAAVRAEHGMELAIAEPAFLELEQLCTVDLFDGGRGIGNQVERHLINPLAHLLFRLPPRDRLEIIGFETSGGDTHLLVA